MMGCATSLEDMSLSLPGWPQKTKLPLVSRPDSWGNGAAEEDE